MMDYLKKYNISDEQIINLENIIDDNLTLDLFKFESEKIMNILDLFISIGVEDVYKIIEINPYLFCDTFNSIKRRIDSYEDKSELARLINEDVNNIGLVNLI